MFLSQVRMTTLVLILLVGLFGCSSGGGDGGSPNPQTLTGRFIDSAVSGITYVTSGGTQGVTGSNGEFTYKSGETVQFYIGGILLGDVAGASLVTPVSMVSGATDETNPTVSNIARFLQSLDDDQDPSNGISISADVITAAAGQVLDFTSAAFDTNADALVRTLRNTAYGDMTNGLVSSASAEQHLRGTLLGELAGAYTGTYTEVPVGDRGTWVFTADEFGNITGCGESTVYLETFSIAGTVSSSGATEVVAGSTSNGATFSGSINLNGSVSGNWSNTIDGSSGTYSGSLATGNVPNCSTSSNPSTPPTAGNLGGLVISGTDTAVIGTLFTPNEVTLPSANSARWRTVVDGGNGMGIVTHSMLVNLDVNGNLTDFVYSRVIDSAEYHYRLDCAIDDCSNIYADTTTQVVTFSNVIVPALAEQGVATAPITITGTLIVQ